MFSEHVKSVPKGVGHTAILFAGGIESLVEMFAANKIDGRGFGLVVVPPPPPNSWHTYVRTAVGAGRRAQSVRLGVYCPSETDRLDHWMGQH